MSRHRNLRKVSIGDDDYEDDMSQSFDDKYSYAVSPGTSEMYMYNRSQTGQSISEFIKEKITEDDEDARESLPTDDAASGTASTSAAATSATTESVAASASARNNDDSLTNEIKSLDVSKTGASAGAGGGAQSSAAAAAAPVKFRIDDDFLFQMDREPNQRSNQGGSVEKDPKVQSKNLRDLPPSQSPKSQPKQVQKTTLANQAKQSPTRANQRSQASNETPSSSSTLKPSFAQLNDSTRMHPSPSTESFKKSVPTVVVDKETLLKQYAEHTAGKDVINLIVIGHVDSGKSTLMGHLLYQLGHVSSKAMHKHKQESQKIGKSSFAYAWVLDETEEERARGVTIDVAQTKFETAKKIVHLLDAPGHKDFIPNMITGATQADSALLVINSIKGEFETGFEMGGQTREHSLLVKSLGIKQLIVVVNKMDMCDWSRDRFDEICKKIRAFLTRQVGFKESDLQYVPCSGLVGENLTTPSNNEKLTSWYSPPANTDPNAGSTLIDCINRLQASERALDKPLRFSVSDVFRSIQTSGSSVALSGKMESGTLKLGERVVVVPANETGVVKALSDEAGVSMQQCFAGDACTISVQGVDMNNIGVGSFVCDCISSPMPVTDRIRARIIIFGLDMPIVKGFPVVFHYKSLNEAAILKRLVSQLDKNTGEVVKEKPRLLQNGMSAIVEIKINKPICVELYANYRELGRFMLRSSGTTIAAGQITEIL